MEKPVTQWNTDCKALLEEGQAISMIDVVSQEISTGLVPDIKELFALKVSNIEFIKVHGLNEDHIMPY